MIIRLKIKPPPPPKPDPSFWHTLERIPGQIAFPSVWRRKVGDQFEAFQTLCLQKSDYRPATFPCPLRPICAYQIVHQQDGSILGTCREHDPICPDTTLTLPDITPLELNWSKLARATCRAFGSSPQNHAALPAQHHADWLLDVAPIILTIQTERHLRFRYVIAELVARLRRPFILLSPTINLVDAGSLELLANFKAAVFGLDTTLRLAGDGTLHALPAAVSAFQSFSVSAFPGQIPAPGSPLPAPSPRPRYAIRKGLGVWHLIFDGKEAILKHERGIFYVAYLLIHPSEQPIHALDLMAKIPEIYRQQLGLAEMVDPATGKTVTMASHARLQERSLALDDAQALRELYRKEKELEAILDDENESEPVKAEALRHLEQIAEFQRQHGRRTQDSAQNAVRAVRRAIVRFHQHLLAAVDQNGNPHPVLRQFAHHLEEHLLTPSARYCGPGGTLARGPLAGRFTYKNDSTQTLGIITESAVRGASQGLK